MKRLVIVVGGLLALPAFAEVAPFYFDDAIEFADVEMMDDGVVVGDEIVAENDAVVSPVVQMPRATARATNNRAAVNGARTVATRNAVSRGVVANNSRGTARSVVSRASGNTNTGRVATRRGANNGVNTARATTTQSTSQRAGLVTTDTTNKSLYIGRSVSARGNSGSSNMMRSPSISVSSSSSVTTASSAAEATATMDTLAEMTDYCKAQYMACMDNFCNVLDDNQGRCTCSKNLKNYEKTEAALKSATEELQEVAQRIQYIGLTGEEITTLFSQTEAELAMQNNTDSTKLKNDLDRIKNMIVDVKGGSASAIGDSSGISLDLSNLLSFNIDSTGFDLTSLFTTGGSSNTAAITNQRGEALYKTAAARCKVAVLNNCIAQGVDAAVISNSYDMEIDKQCIVYERSLSDANSQMVATVRNAKTVLQKARLMVAQQKNQYDLRGCISALDSCMQDEYVCGTDYEDCLDPTGKYIVEGEVVVGSMPGMSGGSWGDDNSELAADKGLYKTWNTNSKNMWAPSQSNDYTMSKYLEETVKLDSAKKSSSAEMSAYLQNKMGYHDDATGRNYGMCISILNKCQDYTYDRTGKYMPSNNVVNGWLERAFRQIKVAQDNVLANYAESCLSDVTACLSQNNYAFNASTNSNPSDMAIKACLPVINSCRSVTLGLDEGDVDVTTSLDAIYDWLDAGISTTFRSACTASGGTWTSSTGKCSCSGLQNSSPDTAERTCVCNSGYTLDTSGSTPVCKSNTTTSNP